MTTTSHGTRLRPYKVSAALLAGVLLSSCGGGDPFAGLWTGSVSPNRDAAAMVLEDGTYYLMYSQPSNPNVLAGVVHGTADFQAAKFTSTDARDYNWEVPGFIPGKASTLTAKISASQKEKVSVSGAVNGRTFSVRHAWDFESVARLADIAGSHTGTVVFALGPRPATFVVTATGQVSTVINGCPITGTVTPRTDANAYDLTMTLGAWPCVIPYGQFSGVAFFRGDRQLHAAVINPAYQQAIGFIGVKQ
jgi:hypothetical protein